jgi:hypothetical protein
MFDLFKSRLSNKLQVMGHEVDVVSIVRDGEVIFTGDTAKAFKKNHLEGQIFEILFSTRSGNPYCVYYLCEDYYFAVAGHAGTAAFGGPFKTQEFRSSAAQQIGIFLVKYLLKELGIDVRADIVSFSHNRAHTNVLAYVSSLGGWYPIQHSESESDSASEQKVAQVNSGRAPVTDFIAIYSPSPSE